MKDPPPFFFLSCFSFLCVTSSRRPPSSPGYRGCTGGENGAEPVVVLDPVSTHEPQTKDQVAEQEPTQHQEDGGEVTAEYKEDSVEKPGERDSSSC